MNVYSMRALVGMATNGFVAGDAANARQLCSIIGHLWLGSQSIKSNFNPMAAVGTPPAYLGSFDTTVGIESLDFMTPKRLPASIEVLSAPNSKSFNADDNCVMSLANEDDSCADRMEQVGSPVVVQGGLVVALTLGGVSVVDQLTTQLRIPVGTDAGGTQYLTLGFAIANAQQGVYENPFSTALAYWFGGAAQTNAPIVVAAGSPVKLLTR